MLKGLALPLTFASLVIVSGCRHESPPEPPKTAKQQVDQGQKPTRIAVKRGMDADIGQVDMTPKDITVEELIAMDRPADLADDISSDQYQEHRVGELEKQVWRLHCVVESIVHRRDGDYFLVVRGESGATTVVEVPDPGLCKGSAVEDQINKARKALDGFEPGDEPIEINEPATIEGIGFWGQMPREGSRGAANGARIMPGTNVKMGD